jgi:diguanylate cyclase (GGDEF)-like protein
MLHLDMRTVFACYVVTALPCALTIALQWLHYRSRYRGLGLWFASYLLQFAGFVLFALRGAVPDLLSMVGGNSAIVVGYALLFIGLRRYLGTGGRRAIDLGLAGLFLAAYAWIFAKGGNLESREAVFSLAVVFLTARNLAHYLRQDAEIRRLALGPHAVLAAYLVASSARIALDLSMPPRGDLFSGSSYDALILVSYLCLFVALTFFLVSMVGRRIYSEQEDAIAEHERAQDILRVRLELREYASGRSIGELMTKALDEIERMTGSSIGFYHFVDEDAGVLTRQAWSSRTLREGCPAGNGAGQGHYPLEKAGIWADCIREKRPVIHNDYATAQGRRGLPEGHPPVVRMLAAPTLRDGKVVAILGVGNKPTGYGEEDVELASYIVDLVWTIVVQKRSDERILELNSRLEKLAMTDELTGIANRRAFFAMAGRELAKARRYSQPLSFLMLDIDHFKMVNDRHGHDSGDAVLRMVADVVRSQVRNEADYPARLGGEEFGVLMPSTGLPEAALTAERLRAAVEAAACEVRGASLKVTVSLGVASSADGAEGLDALMRAADEALYRAKFTGRNRVETA